MPAETTLQSRPPAPALRVIDIYIYRISEDLTAGLIYFMLVFGPWAFGTTQPWSMAVMNGCGYALGGLLFVKLALRWVRHYQPNRWVEGRGEGAVSKTVALLLACVTALIVLFCFVSAVNARATFVPGSSVPVYFQRPEWLTRWLPSSMDAHASWRAFWNYLALTLSFWAIRDWLLGKSEAEIRTERMSAAQQSVRADSCETSENSLTDEPAITHHASRITHHVSRSPFLLPARIRRLLWVLSISGGLLALESIIQRASGSNKLLFLIQPRANPLGETQFGPFAYRANASQYLNLLWPITLAFWWTLQRGGARGFHHLLLAACAMMAAGSIISTSRAGAMVSVLLLVLSSVVLFGWSIMFSQKRGRAKDTGAKWILICGIGALALGVALGWKSLAPRFGNIGSSFSDREGMYEIARPMARDYPVYGTGPGTYGTVFQLYRLTADTYWPGQLHNDWLETRITFGWVGAALIFAAYALVLLRWFVPGGIHGGRRFMILLWLAMGGCLLHARFDFPFQIYSILFLFLVLCALAFDLSHRTAKC